MSGQVLRLVFVVVLCLTAGCVGSGGSAAELTVENADPISYRMTAYVIDEPVGAGNLTIQATNSTGVQETVELIQLETEGPYYNSSLGERWNATERQLVVPANETTTASFDAWEPEDAIVYVFEEPDGRVVRSEFAVCPSSSLQHRFVFSDGPENGYRAQCG